jgi:hypothetical protein
MPEEGFSQALEQLVAQHVASVAALEVLLLLRTSRPRDLDAATVATQLRIDPHFASLQLEALARARLIEPTSGDPRYRYAPETPELEAVVGELETAYARRRVSLVSLIHAAPRDRVRDFADAFRVRKETGDG